MSRYEKVAPGIRRDKKTRKYQAIKTFKSKQFSKTFSGLREAKNWLRSFTPELNSSKDITKKISQIIELYRDQHLPGLSISSRMSIENRFKYFLDENFLNSPIQSINHISIDELIKRNSIHQHRNRASFKNDLKTLRAFFNWYIENYDEEFRNPIKKRHFTEDSSSTKKPTQRKLSTDELALFFSQLKPPFKELALFQFFTASRISEAAAIHWEQVDLSKSQVTIKNVLIWSLKDKKPLAIKPIPKNGEIRTCYLPSQVTEPLRRLKELSGSTSGLIFHNNGEPFSYRQIQYRYQKALKAAGLENVTSTHFLRHSSANLARQLGSLELAQALTGHKSRAIVEKIYTEIPTDLQAKAAQILEAELGILTKNKK